jgi:hypothetical protein
MTSEALPFGRSSRLPGTVLSVQYEWEKRAHTASIRGRHETDEGEK